VEEKGNSGSSNEGSKGGGLLTERPAGAEDSGRRGRPWMKREGARQLQRKRKTNRPERGKESRYGFFSWGTKVGKPRTLKTCGNARETSNGAEGCLREEVAGKEEFVA